jgi:mono/diheme cytochrome c family protein
MKIAIVLALVLLVPSLAHAAGNPAVDHGRAAFMANNCYLCHGTVGQGGANGPAIAPPRLMPTYQAFATWVRKPGSGVMPVYTPVVLDDADLAAIYAYLKSLPPPPSAIPSVLNAVAPH